MGKKPNVIFLLTDQMRGQATGYAGDPNVKTPHLDALARESIVFQNAISGMPVCSPARASMLTGKYPLTHGVFLNDVYLKPDENSIAKVFTRAGYDTAYIGKWHVDGHGCRSMFIPRERRQGFDYWKVLECTHNYFESHYYGDGDEKLTWEGYDAFAQTRDAQEYIKEHDKENPFFLFLSWGPPHAPYHLAPQEYLDMYDPGKIKLRPNVPKKHTKRARNNLAGYYAHITALDECVGMVVQTVKECKIDNDTILVFYSDHGDMLFSQGHVKKQRPWEESLLCPFMIRYPALLGRGSRTIEMPVNTTDVPATLLGLCGIDTPSSYEGDDFSAILKNEREELEDNPILISCPAPFGQFIRGKRYGGREYRGIRTIRYTYIRDLDGPWLLYDNKEDPYQLKNLCHKKGSKKVQEELEAVLRTLLEKTGDEFLPATEYIRKWNYKVDSRGTVPYTN
ncbi:MAG: sulfatase [Candidatus Hodarchaeota archaeon]